MGNAGHLMRVARDRHRNLVKAELCRRPGDWPNSDYREVIDKGAGVPCDYSSVLIFLPMMRCFVKRSCSIRFTQRVAALPYCGLTSSVTLQ